MNPVSQETNPTAVKWHRITEYNDWEGETWYHYFQDSDGVLEALTSAVERVEEADLEIETKYLTWDQAEVLANLEPGYMDIHWFGELTNFDGLATAGQKELYKGGIREFGEELFGYGAPKEENSK